MESNHYIICGQLNPSLFAARYSTTRSTVLVSNFTIKQLYGTYDNSSLLSNTKSEYNQTFYSSNLSVWCTYFSYFIWCLITLVLCMPYVVSTILSHSFSNVAMCLSRDDFWTIMTHSDYISEVWTRYVNGQMFKCNWILIVSCIKNQVKKIHSKQNPNKW